MSRIAKEECVSMSKTHSTPQGMSCESESKKEARTRDTLAIRDRDTFFVSCESVYVEDTLIVDTERRMCETHSSFCETHSSFCVYES